MIEGWREDDARALLDAVLSGPLDARVRDRIVTGTRGNPLALLELPRGSARAELAGGFGCADAAQISDVVENRFRRLMQLLRTRAVGC